MRSYDIVREIKIEENIDKKWFLLQYAYKLWQSFEFCNEPLNIKENISNIEHNIYVGITEMEFMLYIYFLDIKEISLRSKNLDGIINFEKNEVTMIFYDKTHSVMVNDILDVMTEIEIAEMPKFDIKTYFYIPEDRDDKFYNDLISFIYYLSEINIKKNGINICDMSGNFISYNSLNFPKLNLKKFLYYDGNIFIGSHAKNNMLIIYNLPKNKVLELRQWVSQYSR